MQGTWHRADSTVSESPLAWLLSTLRQSDRRRVKGTDSGALLLGFEVIPSLTSSVTLSRFPLNYFSLVNQKSVDPIYMYMGLLNSDL